MQHCLHPPHKVPKIRVNLNCSDASLCDPLPSLVIPWTIQYFFAGASDLNPKLFQSKGLHSICGNKLDSVSVNYLGGAHELSHPPEFEDLDGSKIFVPIPGVKGSTCSLYEKPYSPCNIEVYFFGQGESVGQYHAVMEAQFCTSGNEMVCRVKEIESTLDPTLPIDVTFVAVLRYITLPVDQNITNTFEIPSF